MLLSGTTINERYHRSSGQENIPNASKRQMRQDLQRSARVVSYALRKDLRSPRDRTRQNVPLLISD